MAEWELQIPNWINQSRERHTHHFTVTQMSCPCTHSRTRRRTSRREIRSPRRTPKWSRVPIPSRTRRDPSRRARASARGWRSLIRGCLWGRRRALWCISWRGGAWWFWWASRMGQGCRWWRRRGRPCGGSRRRGWSRACGCARARWRSSCGTCWAAAACGARAARGRGRPADAAGTCRVRAWSVAVACAPRPPHATMPPAPEFRLKNTLTPPTCPAPFMYTRTQNYLLTTEDLVLTELHFHLEVSQTELG